MPDSRSLLHQNGWDKPWDALPTAPIDRDRTSPDGNWHITLADGSEVVFETGEDT